MAKIMVIDDDRDSCSTISDQLKSFIDPCTVITAQSGEEGIEKIRNNSPDVVLLDTTMPNTDGYEVCKRLKDNDRTKHIPIIMLTEVRKNQQKRLQAIELGADAFITKPLDPAQLTAQVNAMLRIKRAEDILRSEKTLLEELVRERTQQLRQSEELYHSIFRIAANLITSVNTDGIIVDCNDRIHDVLGYRREEIIGQSMHKIIHPDHMDQANRTLNKALTQGHSFNDDYRMVRKDGHIIDVVINSSGLTDRDDNYVRTICIITDLTEKKQAEKEREKLLRKLETKNEELESIIYAVSHDLRSPLVNIQGFGGELLKSCKQLAAVFEDRRIPVDIAEKAANILVEDIPESLKFICTSAAKMDVLLNGLLKVSRLGRNEMNVTNLNMNELIAGITGSMAYQIRQADVRIEVDILPDCPGDEAQIQQLFTNLIGNAINYLDKSRPGVINISARLDNSQTVYCVRDNGIGIEPEHQEDIFGIFHRLNPTGPVTGEGLGLTIVKRIVNDHNGRIWVESQPHEGSAFYVALPAR